MGVDHLGVVGRSERREALRAWREVPTRQRLEVVRAARRGEPASDASAAAAARRFAEVTLAPRGPAWFQRVTPRAMGRLLVLAGPVAVVLVAVAHLLLPAGAPLAGPTWLLAAAAVLAVLWGWSCLQLQRDCEVILAPGQPGTDAPH